MPRIVLPLLILAAVVVAAGATWFTLNRGGATSGGELSTSVRAVSGFSRIHIAGAADVTLVQGEVEDVVVEAAPRDSVVTATVSGETLNIASRDTRRWWHSLLGGSSNARTTRITVHLKHIDSLSLAGAVRVSATQLATEDMRVSASGGTTIHIDDLTAHDLRFSGSGALQASLGGKVASQRIAISGAGEYRADDLQCEDVTVSVSGVGSVVVRASKTLKASISGAGSVEYYGDPVVKQSVSGMGRVKRRDVSSTRFTPIAAAAFEARRI